MKKLLVLVSVAAMCLPSYGDILVYKTTCNFNTRIDFTDADKTTASGVSAEKLNGYIVLDIDTDTGELNSNPAVIFYGGKGTNMWRVEIPPSAINVSSYLFDIGSSATSNEGILLYIGWENQGNAGSADISLYGKLANNVAIGRTDNAKVTISQTLKGNIKTWDDIVSFYDAFGSINVTLDTKYTKNANQAGASSDDTITAIATDLEHKGYNL
ncbi:MAG: hypothetical protein ABSG82_08990 [Sedimentisphaerales bacterium]|jgi:uncharacterized protein YdeI (BOF family)